MYLLNFKRSNVFIFLENFCKIMTKVEKISCLTVWEDVCRSNRTDLMGSVWPSMARPYKNEKSIFRGFCIRIPTGRPINNQTKDDPWRKKVKEDSRPLLHCHWLCTRYRGGILPTATFFCTLYAFESLVNKHDSGSKWCCMVCLYLCGVP